MAEEAEQEGVELSPQERAEQRRRRRTLVLLLTPLTLTTVAGLVAWAFTPALLANHPLVLVALSPINRHLVATAPLVDVVPWVAWSFARLLLNDPFTFLLGRRYGDAAIAWVKKQSPSLAPVIEWVEGAMRKAGVLVVAIAPNNWVCVLAGASGISWGAFLAANLAGTAVRLALLRWVGDIFSAPIEGIQEFFRDHLIITTGASIALTVVWVVMERRRGAGEIETPAEMAEEIERELEHIEGDGE